jgi:hypothetical protein
MVARGVTLSRAVSPRVWRDSARLAGYTETIHPEATGLLELPLAAPSEYRQTGKLEKLVTKFHCPRNRDLTTSLSVRVFSEPIGFARTGKYGSRNA